VQLALVSNACATGVTFPHLLIAPLASRRPPASTIALRRSSIDAGTFLDDAVASSCPDAGIVELAAERGTASVRRVGRLVRLRDCRGTRSTVIRACNSAILIYLLSVRPKRERGRARKRLAFPAAVLAHLDSAPFRLRSIRSLPRTHRLDHVFRCLSELQRGVRAASACARSSSLWLPRSALGAL